MTRFKQILKKYSGGNVAAATDKQTTHSYDMIYQDIMDELDKKSDLTILENGILAGSFLFVLQEMFPEAQIYGVDINTSRFHHHFPEGHPNIHVFEMDGTLRSTADFLNQKFDLIIEDASHRPEHQLQSLEAFAPYLKKDGVYVVEDISSRNHKLKQDLEKKGAEYGLCMEWVDLTHVKGRFDDIVAIFRHKQ